MKIFIFIILFFSSQSLSSDLELECFGEPDLPNMYYGKEIFWEKRGTLGLNPKH